MASVVFALGGSVCVCVCLLQDGFVEDKMKLERLGGDWKMCEM